METVLHILKVLAFAMFYVIFSKVVGFEEVAIIMLAQIFYKAIEIHSDQNVNKY